MITLIIACLVSSMIAFIIIRCSHLHIHITGDPEVAGPQKFHPYSVPRIGGLAIIIAMVVATFALYWQTAHVTTHIVNEVWLVLVSATPAFISGLLEDLTKKVGVKIRLFMTILSAIIAYFVLDIALVRLDVPVLDTIIKYWPISLLITSIAVGGIAHAINIIDGYNGLAGFVSLIIISALGYVAFKVGDNYIVIMSLLAFGAIVGFLIWNYPNGLILLGDGGAYLLGFIIGVMSVLLVSRNSEVSPWFPLLLLSYPVTETFFSIYRKKILRGHTPGIPDGLHLHMLVYKRLVRWMVGSQDARHKILRNAMTSPYLWCLTLITTVPAVLFWRYTDILRIFVFAFVGFYVWIYWRLVRFRSPRWLVLNYPKHQLKPLSDDEVRRKG